MASSKEVLKEWLKQGKYLNDDSVVDSLYKMQAPTDELAEQRFLEMYGGVAPFDMADRITEPTIPSMENVIAILGLTDDPKEGKNARTKEQKFIDDFPKKLTEWKKKIEKNPVYGKLGWETVKKIWKHASNQKMLSDIAKARKEAMDDAPLNYGVGQVEDPVPWLSSFLTRTFFPRATEHIENAGNFTAKDILADIGENAAMTIPGGAFTGVAGKGLAKVAPRVVNWASNPGSGFASRALKGAANMGGNIFGNAVVPFASEIMDAILYDDNDEGMEQRADFSLGDALVGTAINQGVNRGLMQILGPMIDRFSPGGIAEGGTTKVRKLLENLGQPLSKKGDDFAKSVRLTDKLKNIREKGNLRPEDVKAFSNGYEPTTSTTADEAFDAFRKASVLDDIDKGKVQLLPEEVQVNNADINHEVTIQSLQNKLKNKNKQIKILEENSDKIQSKIDDAFDASDEVKAALYNRKANNDALLETRNLEKQQLTNALRKDYRQNNVTDLFSVPYDNATLPAGEVLGIIDKNIPEFTNYAKWHGTRQAFDKYGNLLDNPVKSATMIDRIGNYLNQGIPSWSINKYGSEGDATALISMFPETKKAIDENRQEGHDAPKKRKKSAAASDILKGVTIEEELTDKDRKFLSAIEENPDILKFGYKDDPNGFRLWLLEKGNSILQNYPAFRPTFN